MTYMINANWTLKHFEQTEPEPPTVTIEQFRSYLQRWVEKDEARHPDFQDKELIKESKELINKSRDGNELLRTPETF